MKLPAEMSLGQIAQMIGGKVQGEDVKVSSFSPSAAHANPGDIALVADPKALDKLNASNASALIVPSGSEPKFAVPLITVDRPMLAIQRILTSLQPKWFRPAGIHPSAVVDPTAEVDPSASIGALVCVGPKSKIGARTTVLQGTMIGGGVKIGEECLIHQGCMIADFVEIHNRVILQQGVSLGSDGYGYVTARPSNMELLRDGLPGASDDPNPHLKIPQIGTVVLHDDVEVGANTCIDRGAIGPTTIGAHTKIDNLVQIAHNVTVGKEVLIVAGASIAGSVKIADRAIIAGQVGIGDHLSIGKDSIVQACAAVMRDVPQGEVHCGMPAQPAKTFFTEIAHLRRLPKMSDDVRTLKKKIAELEKQLTK